MDKEQLIADWDTSTEKLVRQLSQFPTEKFNLKPINNGWSAAQIAEHLLIIDVITSKALTGETIPTNRPHDEKIKLIKEVMQDMDTKRTGSERVQPSEASHELQRMINLIQQQRGRIKKAIDTTDITEACISFKHPGFGTLTRLEWIYFNIYHTERHIKQMQKMKESVYSS